MKHPEGNPLPRNSPGPFPSDASFQISKPLKGLRSSIRRGSDYISDSVPDGLRTTRGRAKLRDLYYICVARIPHEWLPPVQG